MALFARNLHERIAELEAEVEIEASLHRGSVTLLEARLKEAMDIAADQRRDVVDLIEKIKVGHALEVANLKGQIEALSGRGDQYDRIVRRHSWHVAGKAHAHGLNLVLWECLECRADASANARLLLPEGVEP